MAKLSQDFINRLGEFVGEVYGLARANYVESAHLPVDVHMEEMREAADDLVRQIQSLVTLETGNWEDGHSFYIAVSATGDGIFENRMIHLHREEEADARPI